MLVTQLRPTLCDPMDYNSLPTSSVHGILQARILEWVAIFFSRGSSWPKDWTWVSCISGGFFTLWATRKAPPWSAFSLKLSQTPKRSMKSPLIAPFTGSPVFPPFKQNLCTIPTTANMRTSLVVQWLRVHSSIAGNSGPIPRWRTKISHAL